MINVERNSSTSQTSVFRIAVAGVAIIAAVGTLFGFARWARSMPSAWWTVSSVVMAAVVTILLLGSLFEWLVHRYIYHRASRIQLLNDIFEIHVRGHHWHRFPPTHYVESRPVERIPVWPPEPQELCVSLARRRTAWLGQYLFYMAFAVPFAFAPALLVTRNVSFTTAAVITGLFVCYLFIRVHDVIHYPGESPWMERQGWFRFLDRHHYIHHIDNYANLNFLLPLCDWLFGTLRTRLTADEERRWPSFETAKRMEFVTNAENSAVGSACELPHAASTSSS